MGVLDVIRTSALLSAAPLVEPVAIASTVDQGSILTRSTLRAHSVAQSIAMSIPSVRKAVHVIAGTLSTFAVHGWQNGHQLDDDAASVAWLQQPDPQRTLPWQIKRTMSDLIWHDRSVWRPLDETLHGSYIGGRRVHPNRIGAINDAYDPDVVETFLIDGREISPSRLIVFDGAGIGGLQRYGWELLTLYGQLQTAAGRYAKAPHPHAILKNHGADLDRAEITALLDEWERARSERSIGYLNDVLDYETFGWNAQELQLTEAREHAALEVARLFGLPAFAVDAKSGDSMTYGNTIEKRRDLVEALRPWIAIYTSTLSSHLPAGISCVMDVDAYTRDDTQTRMSTWATALASGVLTLDEVRAAEPLTRKQR